MQKGRGKGSNRGEGRIDPVKVLYLSIWRGIYIKPMGGQGGARAGGRVRSAVRGNY